MNLHIKAVSETRLVEVDLLRLMRLLALCFSCLLPLLASLQISVFSTPQLILPYQFVPLLSSTPQQTYSGQDHLEKKQRRRRKQEDYQPHLIVPTTYSWEENYNYRPNDRREDVEDCESGADYCGYPVTKTIDAGEYGLDTVPKSPQRENAHEPRRSNLHPWELPLPLVGRRAFGEEWPQTAREAKRDQEDLIERMRDVERGKKVDHMMRVSKKHMDWTPKEDYMVRVSKGDMEWTPREDHMMKIRKKDWSS